MNDEQWKIPKLNTHPEQKPTMVLDGNRVYPAVKELHVIIKSIYGKDTVYPYCESSKTFCHMLGQATLTEDNIKYIKQLGYAINVSSLMPTTL